MGLYLGDKKISALHTVEKTTASMKAFLDAGGKCAYSSATSFEGCWLESDWENVKSCYRMFYNSTSLMTVPYINSKNSTSFEEMFYYCQQLVNGPELYTGKATSFYGMFSWCSKLVSVPSYDSSNVKKFNNMFYQCVSLRTVGKLIVNEAENVSAMFSGCYNLTDSGVETINAINAPSLELIFYDCSSLKKMPNIVTSEKLISIGSAFRNCRLIAEVPLFETKNVKNASYAFYYCEKITTIPAYNFSAVTDFGSAFGYCSNVVEFHAYGMKTSFSIAPMTKLPREALVEILGNLATVTNSPTLTMGSTNLAKLTDEDKAIATGKGWKLA